MAAVNIPIRDIHGLDAIPWWPPGPGWWLVGLLVLSAGAGIWLLLRRHREVSRGTDRDVERGIFPLDWAGDLGIEREFGEAL